MGNDVVNKMSRSVLQVGPLLLPSPQQEIIIMEFEESLYAVLFTATTMLVLCTSSLSFLYLPLSLCLSFSPSSSFSHSWRMPRTMKSGRGSARPSGTSRRPRGELPPREPGRRSIVGWAPSNLPNRSPFPTQSRGTFSPTGW